MSFKKILIPSLLGGLAMFIWGILSHLIFQIGDIGIKEIQNEDAVISSMKANMTEAGFYFFPSEGMSSQQADERQKWTEKYKAGPIGIIIYHPTGKDPMSPIAMLTELISNIIVTFFAAIIFLFAVNSLKSFWTRALLVALLGLIASFSIDISYWNWYGFPANLTIASLVDQTVGFFCVGLVLAWRIKPVTG